MVDELYGMERSDAIVNGDQFSLAMTMDVKLKDQPRSKNREIRVYEVRNGKISKEQFFYPIEV